MQPTITTLDEAIAREEKIVGLRVHGPATERCIRGRQLQVAGVVGLLVVALVGVAFSPAGTPMLRIATTLFAAAFVAYALEQDRHLRRLAVLSGDSRRITLAVVDALSQSGALRADAEVLAIRNAYERAAPVLAAGLAELLVADVTRIRVAGPSGELPVAATRAGADNAIGDDTVALAALRRGRAVQRRGSDLRTTLAVPCWYHEQPIAVLEAIAPGTKGFVPKDAALVEAFAAGAVAALRSTT